ncbi:MAG: hypothetical protein HFJ09_12430 [Lachnospiraceae bacterium]|nr:hypothetical protein [Lachnospiraceae bacterium]
MILKNGITGFYENFDDIKNSISSQGFIQFCNELVYNNQGKILAVDLELTGKNFYYCKMQFQKKICYVLLNASYPYVVFASLVSMEKITYIDKPDYMEYVPDNYFVLNREELKMDFENSKNQLNRIEWKQILYWKPKTVGEIIFNFWD